MTDNKISKLGDNDEKDIIFNDAKHFGSRNSRK